MQHVINRSNILRLLLAFSVIASMGCDESSPASERPNFTCDWGFYHGVAFRFATQQDLETFQSNGCTILTNDSLRVYYIPGVRDLSHFEALESVFRTVEIAYTTDLRTLHGLQNLEKTWQISLVHNPQLTDISALSNVSGIVENELTDYFKGLNIADNDALESLEGLPAIERYKGSIYIEENDKLASLSGLDALQGFAPSGEWDAPNVVIIRNNRSLPTCEAEAFVERLENVDEAIIEGNDDTATCD